MTNRFVAVVQKKKETAWQGFVEQPNKFSYLDRFIKYPSPNKWTEMLWQVHGKKQGTYKENGIMTNIYIFFSNLVYGIL